MDFWSTMVHSPIDSGKLLNGARLSAASGAAKNEFTNMAARNRVITIMNRGVSLFFMLLFRISPQRHREKKTGMRENQKQTGTWLLVLSVRSTIFLCVLSLTGLCPVSAVNAYEQAEGEVQQKEQKQGHRKQEVA